MSGSRHPGGAGRPAPEAAGNRVIGARHRREGKPCQDAIHWEARAGAVALAVADGHGTCPMADVGARLAVEGAVALLLEAAAEIEGRAAAVEEAARYAREEVAPSLVADWARRVRLHAGEDFKNLRSYGSTLLFALATDSLLILGHLGDGDILLVLGDKSVSRPLPPDPRCFANETTSLCQEDAASSFRVEALPLPAAEALLLLTTDGYANSCAAPEHFEAIGPDYLDLLREAGVASLGADLEDFLGRVTEDGNGDDVTLGLLYWPAQG